MISPAAQSFSQMTPFDPNLQEHTNPSQEKSRESNLGQGKTIWDKGKQPRARESNQGQDKHSKQ